MGIACFAVLGTLVVVFQTLTVVSSESSCVPGFTSDMYIFNVYRKRLHRPMRIGKVDFNDCTDRQLFLFSSSDNAFKVQTDGTLIVKLPVVLHDRHRDLSIHTRGSNGHKFTVPVRVVNQRHHNGEGHHHGGHDEQHQGDVHSHHHGNHHAHHNAQHHGSHHQRENDQDHQNPHNEHHHLHSNVEQGASPAPAAAVHGQNPEEGLKRKKRDVDMENPVLFFPKATQGLKRRKREWIIPDIKVSENDRGPFPKKVVQIRSSEDKLKMMRYSITGHGADLEPVDLFKMDPESGNLFVTQPLDREKQAIYTLQAHAVADGGTAENPMDINVVVIDQNDNKPIFQQATYLGEVAESSPIGFEILQVVAIDLDEPGSYNSEIQYRIIRVEPQLPSAQMFEINPVNGYIRVNAGGLDREKFPKYTLDISAADMKGDGLHGETQVILTVTDSNDNAPAYSQNNLEAIVPENKVDAFVTKLTVTDRDDPHTPAWNAKFTIVSGDPEGFFTVKTGPNKQEGIITTAKGLDFERSRKHTLLVAVENEVPFALSLATATATVVVNVEDVNEAPIFDPKVKQVAKPENLVAGGEVVQYIAHDPDTALNQKVMYKILRDPAGWLNVAKDTGLVTVKSEMDREHYLVKEDIYTALIGAYDDDDVPATGTGTLQIVLQDVNDNAPTIDQRTIKVCNKESAPHLLTVTDKDGEGNAAPYRVSLDGPSKANWTARMNDTKTGIILGLTKQLEIGIYSVVLTVGDNQGYDQESTIQAEVCDCTGEHVKCIGRIAGGPPLSIILGILGGILLLLMLLLLLLMFARRRGVEKKEPLLQDDDVRDNIYYYDEEGGGEDDQDYDLSVLHRGLDNKPDVFRNDVIPNFMPAPQYRPRPANPEDIGNFIDDNLKAADNDPTAPPYDSLLVFDYEGGGSDAGSLSSLNSSSSGDQDYNCLNEWGPRFKKLADMYGGGEDDDML